MYKVFINNLSLILAGSEALPAPAPGTLVVRYDASSLFDLLLAGAFGSENQVSTICVTGSDPEKMFLDLLSHCTLIEAAGGVVTNREDKTLLIFRRGKWDLPKGKLDKGESPEEAALREVEEECGIKKLSITGKCPPTFHTYVLKGKIILKKTHWFRMAGTDHVLKPQLEEDITEAKWMNDKEIAEAMKNTYLSVIDVLGCKAK